MAEPFNDLARMVGIKEAVAKCIGKLDDAEKFEQLLAKSGRHIMARQARWRKGRDRKRCEK
ncbi:hypothetical protein M4951_22730 [Blastopirellula sp. J2-11]|uniref:hypothetical protein n=1 Tax=Blastopirellula sp. J2-11 TaxID=2943192 RepID=UPI0021C6C759|nr:hypothetical protein [Blastopirellula sp. J2-11]UUO06161.1 hypothetical protein M4951_22730 [Blastopirellula sp. J2-11]